MLNIESFPLGPLLTNAYLLADSDGTRGVVIDPGMNPEPLIERIKHMEIAAILLTHAHFDHIGGVERIRKLKQCPVYLHAAEADWLTDPMKNGSGRWQELGPPIAANPAEHNLEDGQTLNFFGIDLFVMHTPGHSPGSVSFLHEHHLFAGDALFRMSVGRTDLPGGSAKALMNSIHGTLFELGDAVRVYPGHGPETTIGFEKANNPYV